MHSTKLLLAAALMISMAACKKDDETKVTVKDKLMAKKWKSTGLVSDGVASDKWCWLNSIYEYTEAGTLYETQGDNLNACSGSNIGEINSMPYKISADEKYMIILSSWPTSSDTFEIISLTETEFKTKRVVNKSNPNPNVWEDTYTAQ